LPNVSHQRQTASVASGLSGFRVKALITQRPPHRSVLEEFHSYGSSVYKRTRCDRSAHVHPERRHSFWRITMLPRKKGSQTDPLHTLSEGTVTRFVGSESHPSFIPEIVIPGFSFPSVGRLGLTSPPYRQDQCPDIGTMIHYDCQKPIPGLFALRYPPPIPYAIRLYKETVGSLQFPRYPFEYMLCS
jgi:hypothetical protein